MSERALPMLNVRALAWLGFFGVILGAWWLIYDMARGADWLCGPEDIVLLPLGGFWALMPMWGLMIAAMMLPTMVPTLSAYDDLRARAGANAGATTGGWLGLLLGYVLVWLLGSAGFALAQVRALDAGLLDLTGALTSPWLGAALFLLAGVYQFTRSKEACQDACLSPMQYFIAKWRPGFSGGLRMGAGIGGYCVGCCWAVMALGFVGGMMSLVWMGLATLFMVMEKLPDIGRHLRKPAGGALILASAYLAAGAAGMI